MIKLVSLWKTTSIGTIAMLAIGTCCFGFANNEAHAMHMQDMHRGTIIICADSFGDTGIPCPSSEEHRIVVANTSSPARKDFSAEGQNNTPALPTFQIFQKSEIEYAFVDISFQEPDLQKKTKWVTTLPRSHLG